ncbi:MAG: SIMPL domain-containing protein [Clostridia bacterium]|nr:SIMPL domain-containing protein [Clostridia bacterium]
MKKNKLIFACLFILFLVAGCNSTGSTEVSTIDTIGNGKITAEPDQIEISFTVETEGQTEAVQSENASKTEKVINALLELGLNKEDLETKSINFTPVYKYVNGERKQNGFRASNTIVVKTEKVDLAGKIMDTAVANGATSTGGVAFILSEAGKEKLLDQAVEKAVADARKQAESAAKALGVQISGIKNVTVVKNDPGYPGPIYFDVAVKRTAATVETPVLPAEQEVVVTVNVSFIIK